MATPPGILLERDANYVTSAKTLAELAAIESAAVRGAALRASSVA